MRHLDKVNHLCNCTIKGPLWRIKSICEVFFFFFIFLCFLHRTIWEAASRNCLEKGQTQTITSTIRERANQWRKLLNQTLTKTSREKSILNVLHEEKPSEMLFAFHSMTSTVQFWRSNQSRQMAAHHWVWFFSRFLSVKGQFYLCHCH